jgi:hypothetical protein
MGPAHATGPIAVLTLAFAALGLVAGCSKPASADEPGGPPAFPAKVITTHA